MARPVALDTNLLVRLVTNDDPAQAALAAAAIEASEACFVPLTVSLELEWVLRGAYKLDKQAVLAAFAGLLSVRQLRFEQEELVRGALELHRKGLDFSDALHHQGSGSCAVLLSFDRSFVRQARHLSLAPPVQRPQAPSAT
ncbi:type II toxin-antitoxin system VapC family toxin [Cyanobium sp. ATX 6F1]|uniref:type II toxin-antitoxin system VapC family toxin n=1 Tax=Cyanobium sp. ATX 6F1 TaxID=2823702 RepID=UPI0020CE183E|nr:type II toxin-antitoxin system VapC family toxin [Cyanobium sp. ATX 6F1]MCP9917785.1 type II toxin-antitoxin system VapC family toxin [Cyanobium sp. ATX 6F1]